MICDALDVLVVASKRPLITVKDTHRIGSPLNNCRHAFDFRKTY